MSISFRSAAFGLALLGATQMSGGRSAGPVDPPPVTAPVNPVGNTEHFRTPQMCVLYHLGLKEHDPIWIHRTGAVAVDQELNVYGAGPQGGEYNRGAVFKVTPQGELTRIHDFNWTDGADPEAGVTLTASGQLYGTTYEGGDAESGGYKCPIKAGTLYSMSSDGGGFHVIWHFRNGWLRPLKHPKDRWSPQEILDSRAGYPVSPPVQTQDGQWYGVASYSNNQQYGIFYTIGFQAKQIFDGIAVNYPVAISPGVVPGDNNVYGAAWGGAKSNPWGAIFRGNGGGFSVIHTFKGTDGAKPAYVIQGKDGRLYGTTTTGSRPDLMDAGSIFSMTPSGGDFKIVHAFNHLEGAVPLSGVVWGSDNRLYGTTKFGGKYGRGVFYRVDPDGKNFAVLHHFNFWGTGRSALGRITEGPDHNFYGTTYQGGKFDKGVVFKMDVGLSTPGDIEGFQGRWCCSLGQGATVVDKAIEPGKVVGHKYGGGDVSGFIYTTYAGLIDIGHLRDHADITKYLYDFMMALPRNKAKYPVLKLAEGDVQILKLPSDQDSILEMAGAIAYIEGWAHELTTWDDTVTQKFSSFSPEDLVSNIAGIHVGKLAIKDCCEVKYNQAVDTHLLKLLNELNAQPEGTTTLKLQEVFGPPFSSKKGKWYTATGPVEVLWRHNFYPYPWLIPYQNVGAWWPRWLTTKPFEPYWDGTWFEYTIRGEVNGKKGVTLKEMMPYTKAMEGEWVRDNPGMNKWP